MEWASRTGPGRRSQLQTGPSGRSNIAREPLTMLSWRPLLEPSVLKVAIPVYSPCHFRLTPPYLPFSEGSRSGATWSTSSLVSGNQLPHLEWFDVAFPWCKMSLCIPCYRDNTHLQCASLQSTFYDSHPLCKFENGAGHSIWHLSGAVFLLCPLLTSLLPWCCSGWAPGRL